MSIIQSDINLIESILAGDRASFKSLYDRYKKEFFLLCMRYSNCRMEAEDFLQEAFIKIYKDLNKFNPTKGTFKPWAYRVVINVCLQKLRAKKSNLVAIDSTEISNIDFGEHDRIIESLSLQELTKLIQALPEGYRMVFNMFIIDGYSHKDIAEILDISESTSKTQLLKAKRKLQQEINSLYNLEINQYG